MAKKLIRLPFFPNLVHTEEVEDCLSNDAALIHNEESQKKILEDLKDLNDFGTNKIHYTNKENLKSLGNGWWELRIRCAGNCWRIFFRKISPEQYGAKYGLVYMYNKKETRISKKVWQTLNRVAKRESWLS